MHVLTGVGCYVDSCTAVCSLRMVFTEDRVCHQYSVGVSIIADTGSREAGAW